MRCALDLDGVLAVQASFSELDKYDTWEGKLSVFMQQDTLHSPSEFGFQEGDSVTVITARMPEMYEGTLTWLKSHFPKYDFVLHVVPYGKDAAEKKVALMLSLGVTDYYDDRADWCERIRAHGINAVQVL